MDLHAVAVELAGHAPDGWNPYGYEPGSASLPALVVSFDEATFDGTLGFARVRFRVHLVVPPQFTAEAEAELFAQAVALRSVYHGLVGTSFRSCRVERIRDFFTITVGSIDARSVSLDLELLVSNT
jgi:hypothetical protein